MRYHYEKPSAWSQNHGRTYKCDHPLYSACTLYKKDTQGLAVVQQRWNPKMKLLRYGPIDPWLVDQIYASDRFRSYFYTHAGESQNGLYPTVDVRKLMYAVRMKPLERNPVEKFLSPK